VGERRGVENDSDAPQVESVNLETVAPSFACSAFFCPRATTPVFAAPRYLFHIVTRS